MGKREYNEARAKANQKWEKANVKRLLVKLYLNTDKDILEKLETMKNKQGYIKQLIRKDIAEDRNRSIDNEKTEE